ncbi:uncharacterized protein [Nicotiana sylvestris]|uniref:uncharacterized protein n=1 Tax=Nicotiana sylvestris TaxID=4096 RepID=UPI00388CA74D
MDWLPPYHVVLDCHAKTVTLAMPGLPGLEWKGSTVDPSSHVFSFLKAWRMIEKGCLAYLAYVRDTTTESPMIDSVPVVREFANVFPSDLPGMPPDRDIDLAPGTKPISIPPHCMAPKELKELKKHLGELLAKGFVRPSVSPWGVLVLFVKKKDGTMRMCIDYRQEFAELATSYFSDRDQEFSRGRLCVPNIDGLRERILEEAYSLRYSIYPGATKMHRDLRQHYWWRRMKKDIVEYVARCLNCQQVKYEHQRPGWFEPGEAKLYCTNLVQDALEKVKIIQERLRTTQSRQKSYTDQKARDISFMVSEKVLLKVSPMKGVMRFGKKGKLSPRFISQFEVLKGVGKVAYELALPPPPILLGVHPVFNVSMLRKYHADLSHVLDFSTIQLVESLHYEEEPVTIIDRQDH